MGEALSLVSDLYAAFGDGDIEAVLGRMHRDARWYDAESSPSAAGNPYIGPAGVLQNLQQLGASWENLSVVPARLHECEDTVVATGRYRGTSTATGQPLDAQFAHVWTVRGGQVVSFQQYTDTFRWRKAAGTLHDPPGAHNGASR